MDIESNPSARSSVNIPLVPLGQSAPRIRRSRITRPFEEEDLDHYENFTTIDWMRDFVKDSEREYRQNMAKNTWISQLYGGLQSWILLVISGIGIGLFAACLDILTAFFSDIKRGVCITEWYLSKDVCCQGLTRSGEFCPDFISWSQYLLGVNIGFLNFVFYLVASILFALGSIYLTVTYSWAHSTGSGLSEIKTILGGFIIKGFLSVKTLLIKSVTLVLAVSAGLSLGKEEPLVHFAGCLGFMFQKHFSKYLNNEARKRELLSALSAAGFAVAFGAPISGVLFSLEELSYFFPSKTMFRSFFCALISCMALQLIDPYRGKEVLYQVTYTRTWFPFEIIPFAILGVFGGLSGAFFIKLNLKLLRLKADNEYLKYHPILSVIGLAIVTSVLGYISIFSRIDGSELIEYLFRECTADEHLGLCSTEGYFWLVLSLIWVAILKFSLTLITAGPPFPGGVFLPSMIWGALVGRVLGEIVHSIQQAAPHWVIFQNCPVDGRCIIPGMYALVGAIGALGGITKLNVTLTVLMFELTGTPNYVIPCMVTLLIAKFAGGRIEQLGIISVMIKIKGYPYLDPRREILTDALVSEKMTAVKDLVCLYNGITLDVVEKTLLETDFSGYPIVQSAADTLLIGYISRRELEHGIEKFRIREFPAEDTVLSFNSRWSSTTGREIQLSRYVEHNPLTVESNASVEFVLDLFKKLGTRFVFVEQMGQLLGLLTKKDLLLAIESADYQVQRESQEYSSLNGSDEFINLQ